MKKILCTLLAVLMVISSMALLSANAIVYEYGKLIVIAKEKLDFEDVEVTTADLVYEADERFIYEVTAENLTKVKIALNSNALVSDSFEFWSKYPQNTVHPISGRDITPGELTILLYDEVSNCEAFEAILAGLEVESYELISNDRFGICTYELKLAAKTEEAVLDAMVLANTKGIVYDAYPSYYDFVSGEVFVKGTGNLDGYEIESAQFYGDGWYLITFREKTYDIVIKALDDFEAGKFTGVESMEPNYISDLEDIPEPTPTPVPSTPESTAPSTEVQLEYILGDADENGEVNIKDATLIQKHVAEIAVINGVPFEASDADMNGTLNVKDATAIQKYAAEIDTGLPIGELVSSIYNG